MLASTRVTRPCYGSAKSCRLRMPKPSRWPPVRRQTRSPGPRLRLSHKPRVSTSGIPQLRPAPVVRKKRHPIVRTSNAINGAANTRS